MGAPKKKLVIDDAKALIIAKLKTSCLTEKDGLKLGIKVADPAELLRVELPASVPAMELPYFGLDGKPTGFKRWRYLADSRTTFQKAANVKERRYVQAPGSPVEVYLPPLVDWKTIAADPSTRLVFTEGELKAACCTRHVRPCLGLGGVYSFKSVKRGIPLLPIFADFEWRGRDVVVAFDSDAKTNSMVVAARNELCRVLLSLGARPRVAEVPARTDGDKQGLDDLCLAEGKAELQAVLDDAEPFAAAEAFHEMNEEVAYVKDPGLIVVMASGLKMRASDFTGHAYSNRHYTEKSIDAKGNEKLVKKPTARNWLDWPGRQELRKMAYEPGQPQVTERGDLNTWLGWGCEPVPGDIGPWKELLDNLFHGHAEERSWFERWCAIPLQRPGTKMFTAAVLWSVATGTGKSSVFYALGKVYGDNFCEIGDAELQDNRNEWAQGKQLVVGDDVTGKDQRKYADRLKAMITQREMWFDPKYVPKFKLPACVNYGFTSNHPDAFFIEDDDRRFFVHEVSQKLLGADFWRRFYRWMDTTGPSALFAHLLQLDLKGMEPEDRAPVTGSKLAMVEDGLSDIGAWVRRLRDDPDTVLRIGDVVLQGDLWGSTDLSALYDPENRKRVTAGGLGRELKRAGMRQVYGGMPVRTAQGQLRLFAVRNAAEWDGATQKRIVAHYDATRCTPAKKRKL